MAYDKRRVTFTTTAATGSGTTNLAYDYAELIGMRTLSTGDAATQVTLTDGAGRVVYKDAADKDYTTAKDTTIGLDATLTGLSLTAVDATGAAQTIALGQGVPVQSPIVVSWANGTSGDAVTCDLYYRGPVWRSQISLTVPNPAATVTGSLALRSKYAQLLGATVLSVGTDAAMRLRITDADSRIIYLDAADRDYDTATVHLAFASDDTLTGLTPQLLDATGAASTATSVGPSPVAKSPLEIAIVNGGTAGDIITASVWYRAD